MVPALLAFHSAVLIFWLSQQKTRFMSTWSHLAGNCFLYAELIGVLNLSSQMILPMAAEE